MLSRAGREMMSAASKQFGRQRLRTAVAPFLCRDHDTNIAAALPTTMVRFYRPSPSLGKKFYDDESEENKVNIPGLPDIQTLNRPEGMTDEEVMAILEEEEQKMADEEAEKYVKDWKPGMRKRPLVMSFKMEDFENENETDKNKRKWLTRLDRRCGALGIKVGMLPVFDDWGIRRACTVILMDKVVVLGNKTMEKHGYMSVQLAAGERKRKNVSGQLLGQYKGILWDEDNTTEHAPYIVREFRVSDPDFLIPVNTRIHAMHFVPGQNVDIAGTSKGKGFQGGMKRHGFKGMPASHGVSRSHRSIGSTGQCQDPGRVFKGKKMPGRMGNKRVTVQNKRIIKIDRGRNLLYIIGSIPGNKGSFVEIRDAVKNPMWNTEKVLDNRLRPPLPTFEFDSVDGSGEPGHEVFMPISKRDPKADPDEEIA